MTKLAPALDAALTYAAHGLKAFPLKPRSKEPATQHGFKDATTDGGILHRRFAAAGADANVAIATGDGIIVIDADEWREDIDLHLIDGNEIPRTWTVKTGRGRHLYFRVPRTIRTIPSFVRKLDIKGEGGYVVAPPSVHPDGSVYEWIVGGPTAGWPITDAPDWMLALFEEARPRSAPKAAAVPQDIIATDQDAYGARQASILAAKGFPMAEARAALEAMIGTRFAGGWAGLDSSRPWKTVDVDRWLRGAYDKFYDPGADAMAAADAKLQSRAAAKPQRTSHRSAPDDVVADVDDKEEAVPDAIKEEVLTGWESVDLGPFLRGEVTFDPPTMLDRADGVNLLYPGKLHWISGEPEGLKSWLAQIAVADALVDGFTAMYVDFEGHPIELVGRLRNLGVTDPAMLERLSYHRPETPMTTATITTLLDKAAQIKPVISVIDGVNAAMGASGLDSNHSTDFHQWWTRFGHRLQAATSGPTIAIDHVVKNSENRNQYAAGTGQKLATVDVHIGTLVKEQFGIGMTGRAKLILHKDRPGYLRPQATGKVIGELTIRSDRLTHAVTFVIEPVVADGDGAGPRFTFYMQKVSLLLEGRTIPLSRTDIRNEKAIGKTEYVIKALDALVAEGYIAAEPSGRTESYSIIKPYREGMDPKNASTARFRSAGHTPKPELFPTVPEAGNSSVTGTVPLFPPIGEQGTGNGSAGVDEVFPKTTVPAEQEQECPHCGDINWMHRRGRRYCGSCSEWAA